MPLKDIRPGARVRDLRTKERLRYGTVVPGDGKRLRIVWDEPVTPQQGPA